MIFVYIRIYYAAKARANRGVITKKKPKSKPVEKNAVRAKQQQNDLKSCVAAPSTTTSFSREGPAASSPVNNPTQNNRNGANERTSLLNKKVHICDVRVHEEPPQLINASTQAPPDVAEGAPLRTVSEQVDADDRTHNTLGENGIYLTTIHSRTAPDVTLDATSPSPTPTLLRDPCGGSIVSVNQISTLRRGTSNHSDDGDHMSDMEPSSSDSGAIARCSIMKPLKLRFCQPLMGKKLTKPKRELIDMGRVTTPKARDPEKEKRRIARKKEKRATLILGLIMGSFIACWLPFFLMYILGPICPIACRIPEAAFDMAFWLGYMNSAFNPVIYTIFNKDFRRAFRKILFK